MSPVSIVDLVGRVCLPHTDHLSKIPVDINKHTQTHTARLDFGALFILLFKRNFEKTISKKKTIST